MKALLLSLLFFLSVGKLLGQQPYYKYGETTHGKKTSYHVSQDSLFVIMEKIEGHPIMKPVRLQNINNKHDLFDNKKFQRKNGRMLLEYPMTTAEIVYRHLKQEMEALLDAKLGISIHMLANRQGDIVEISFLIWDHPAWQAIPPDTYYMIEQEIKKKIKLADPESFNEDYIYAVTDISFFGTQKELLEEEKEMKELSKEFYIYEQNRRKMREKRESRK